MILLNFPSFNIYSTPLLVLVLQGLIFFVLLFQRYLKKRKLSDLLLALILLITCWHQTTYTIGFMGWYDTYRNTKINYFLIDGSLALAPLIYFYVKSITATHFRFRKQDYYHFVPMMIFVLYKIILLLYDAAQPGFDDTQNGYLKINIDDKYVGALLATFRKFQMVLYLAFSLQLYYNYREKIQQIFSNTFTLELNWLRNFLFIYSFLFVYSSLQSVINMAITDLSWTQEWWYFFFSALAIIYIGIKGYFTSTNKLNELNLNPTLRFNSSEYNTQTVSTAETAPTADSGFSDLLLQEKDKLSAYMAVEKPYLQPDLNLIELARSLKMTRAQLSEIINIGFQKNFNDFVNQYRVDAVTAMLQEGKQEQLSLLGIAFECGFNSKATFNRVFKKLTGASPSEYLRREKAKIK